MPTPLTKPVAREVRLNALTPRPMVVTLTQAGIQFRLKGTRTSYLLPYGVAHQRAAQLEADQAVRTKRARRTSRGLLTVGAR